MPISLSAKEIVERALRKIGSLSINDTAADTIELEEGLHWLDLIMSELAGTEYINFLVEDKVSFALSADTQVYNLKTVAGADWPNDGMAFPLSAYAETGSSRQEVKLLSKARFDALDTAAGGGPQYAYIDRSSDPVLKVWPTPGDDNVTFELTFQKFSSTFYGNSNSQTGLRPSWQRWAIYALAAEIGDGPVRRLPLREVDRFGKLADVTLFKLQAFDRSFETANPITPYYDGV